MRFVAFGRLYFGEIADGVIPVQRQTAEIAFVDFFEGQHSGGRQAPKRYQDCDLNMANNRYGK